MKSKENDVVRFSVDLNYHSSHLFRITMEMDDASIDQRLSLPIWTPGSYMVREFSQHIVSIEAEQNGQKIEIAKIDKNTFVVHNTEQKIRVEYVIYGFDSSIRAAYIDNQQAFFNGTALFLRPHGKDQAGYQLTIERPFSETWSNHQVASNMKPSEVNIQGFGAYIASSYSELVDYPFQISTMQKISFVAEGIPHQMVLVGDVRAFDRERLCNDVSTLCSSCINLFKKDVPFSSYLFIARFEEGGHGGLEHHNSSMLLASPYSLPKKGIGDTDVLYRNFLSLCAHEYFHAWNVKKLKPRNFIDYNYDRECYTTLLWVFEGLTSYYDDLIPRRAGLSTVGAYLDTIGKNYTRLLKTPGRKIQSVADSSFDAWIKFYRPNENSPNTMVSYYLKGSLIGLYLDLTIRLNSNHRQSLDDVMRSALTQFGGDKGLLEEDFLALLKEYGINVDDLKNNYLYGTKEFDLKPLLSAFGVDLSLGVDEFWFDEKVKASAWLGFKLKVDSHSKWLVSLTEHNSPAALAGLAPQDEILAIGNVRLDESNKADLLSSIHPKEHVEIIFARKKIIQKTTIIAEELPKRICKVSLKAVMNKEEEQAIMSWLNHSLG